MSASNILSEYLIRLGFTTDKASTDRATKTIKEIESSLNRVAKVGAAATVAATAYIERFASGLERMYYASMRSESSVRNLQAMASGAERIGVGGDRMLTAIEGMARAVRLNPGLRSLIESLGVRVQGRDMSDVMVDLVSQLKQMEPFIAAQYGSLFGIDADTLLLLTQGVEQLKTAAETRRKLADDLGVDMDKAAKAAVEYKNTWRDIKDIVSILTDVIALKMLPGMQEFGSVAKMVLQDWVKIIQRTNGMSDFLDKFMLGAFGLSRREGVQLSAGAQWRVQAGETKGVSVGPGTGAPATSGSSKSLFAGLEQKYNLPSGLLDSMWLQESSRGKHMLSPAGARGHFGFMPGTAKQYGVNNPDDLNESASGAARYMSELLAKYGGNMNMALAAYNWGMGNLAKSGLGNAPLETRNYMRDVQGRLDGGVSQTNHITVYGAGDPQATANAIAAKQSVLSADLVRNQMQRTR